MLGLCNPNAQAALGAVVRPLRHYARHWAHHGVGHGARHAPLHHAAAPHIAAPQASGPMIACTKMPGSPPAGPLPAAAVGPAGSGAFAGPNGGVVGSGYAGSVSNTSNSAALAGASAGAIGGGGSMFGSGGLAAAAAPLAAAALIAAGLVTGTMAKPNQPFRFEQPVFQLAAMASMTPPVFARPAPNAFSPDLSFPETPTMLAAGPQPSATIPDLLEQMPKAPVLSTGGGKGSGAGAASNAGSTAVPEPASLALLGFFVLSALVAREWGRASQGRFSNTSSLLAGSNSN